MDTKLNMQAPSKVLINSRKLHRWLMSIVGIQVFVWAMTGLYMVLPSIHYIHGDYVLKQTQSSLQNTQLGISFNDVYQQYPNASNVELAWLGDTSVYRFAPNIANSPNSKPLIMLNANTGELLSALQETQVRALLPHLLAENEIQQSSIKHIQLLTNNTAISDFPSEIGRRGMPLWQIELDNWDHTTLYVSQASGKVIYVRHHAWRLFDALWRLHIMDYTEGEDISNYLLAFSSLTAFVAIITGLILLYFRLFMRKGEADEARITISENTPRSLVWTAKRAHKWLALFVFIQLVLWVSSGFTLGRLDMPVADGKLTIAQLENPRFQSNKYSLVDIQSVLRQHPKAEKVTLVPILNSWVYKIQHSAGRHAFWRSNYTLVDAVSGQKFDIDSENAKQIALHSYSALSQLTLDAIDVELLNNAGSILPKEENPIWLVSLHDNANTQVLIRANTGLVIGHYNSLSYWRNLLLKLHYMDYANEGSFNNIFMKLFAFFTLLLSLSGLVWLFNLVKSAQFEWPQILKPASRLHELSIEHVNSNLDTSDTWPGMLLPPNDTLLEAIISNDIPIQSICAGGGMCGKCVFQADKNLKPTEAETQLLSAQQLSQNIRLACQHKVKEVSQIKLA